MNIAIVRAFIGLRKMIIDHKQIMEQLKTLKDRIGGHDVQLNKICEVIEALLSQKAKTQKWENR